MARDLLFEMGVEEIPASYILPAVGTFVRTFESELSGARLSHGAVRTFATPRRMTVVVEGVADEQTSETRTVTGPPAKVAFGDDGAPTKAATGFARSQGVEVSDLTVVDDYVQVEVTDEGRPAADVLPGLLSAAADAMGFPKTMKWGPERRFARPVRWLVALLGDVVLDLEYAGVRAGSQTYGLRFWAYGPHAVGNAGAYEELLLDNMVIADDRKRRAMIVSAAERAARDCGGRLVEDEGLLDEVTFLTEFPTIFAGNFDERFLKLPRDVIVAAMKGHQRYFAVETDDGKLLPHFLCVVNGPSDHHDVIREGNERVIESRLDDAEFYWIEDTKSSLEGKVDDLKNVVWLEGVGSLYEKTERLEALAARVAEVIAPGAVDTAVRAARLAKADLVTEMVKDGKEFTELQGVMGREYALQSGETPAVATAIREHYLPRFAGDVLPATPAGTALSMADKIDSITGCFSVGLIPTGSQDPYALRRQAIGLVRIIDEGELAVSLGGLVRHSASGYGVTGDALDELIENVTSFMRLRARTLFIDAGNAYDLVDAVLESSFDRLVGVRPRLEALGHFRAEDDFEGLVIGARRAMNILKGQSPGALDAGALAESAAKALYEARESASTAVEKAVSSGDFDTAVRELLKLRKPIDRFFDEVMVMVEDPALREARLALLQEIKSLFLEVADFAKVVLEGEEREE